MPFPNLIIYNVTDKNTKELKLLFKNLYSKIDKKIWINDNPNIINIINSFTRISVDNYNIFKLVIYDNDNIIFKSKNKEKIKNIIKFTNKNYCIEWSDSIDNIGLLLKKNI